MLSCVLFFKSECPQYPVHRHCVLFPIKNCHECEQSKHARASARHQNKGGAQERKEKNVCGHLWEKRGLFSPFRMSKPYH